MAKTPSALCTKRDAGYTAGDNQAVEWYRKAAEQGNANGQANLGVMYRDGRSVAQSRAEAERWLKKAAEQGNAGAQDNLARLDRAGRNVPRDDQQAIATYALLSLIGNQLTVVTTTSESVRGISGTKKEVLPLKDGSLDLAA